MFLSWLPCRIERPPRKGIPKTPQHSDENRDLVVRIGQIDIRLIWGMCYSMIRFSYRPLAVLVV